MILGHGAVVRSGRRQACSVSIAGLTSKHGTHMRRAPGWKRAPERCQIFEYWALSSDAFSSSSFSKIRFRPGLRPELRWWSLRRSSKPLSRLGRGTPLPLPPSLGVSIRHPRRCAVIGWKLKQNASGGCNRCASLIGLVLKFYCMFYCMFYFTCDRSLTVAPS